MAPEKLLNRRSVDGLWICPACDQPIGTRPGVKVIGDYAYHIPCNPKEQSAR